MNVRIEINSTNDILAKRKLQDGGPAQQLFTKECALCFNNYVPFKSGTLKDLDVQVNLDNIVYYAPYARKQYYENKGNGIGGVSRNGRRGKLWDKRGFADHKDEIIDKVASFVGGKRG
ncbi:minor capsid protein [Clostridium perfringens]|nr:minor capsid protein [Clostridium perfringens]